MVNYRFNDPFESVQKGYQAGNALREDGAMRRAGNALRGGDLGGASGELYGAGLIREGMALEDRATKLAKSRQDELLKYTSDAAGRLADYHRSTKDVNKTLAVFDQMSSRFRELGETDGEIAQVRQQIAANPEGTLVALGAGAAKKAGYEVRTSGDEVLIIDPVSGGLVTRYRGAKTATLNEGDSLLDIPGSYGAGGPASPPLATGANPDAPAPRQPEGFSAPDAPLTVAALDALPSQLGGRITSGQRTAQRNAAVGGVPNSKHLTNEARDLVPPPGVSMDEFEQQVRAAVPPGVQVINEGDHIHVEIDGGRRAQAPTRQAQGPRVIASRPKAAKPQQVRLSPEEVEAAGYQPGSVVFRDPVTGDETVKQSPKAEKPPTEGQVNAASLAYAAFGGNERLNELAKRGVYKPASPSESLLKMDNNGVWRVIARTETDRQFIQAAKEFLAPILRKDTGAAVTDSELAYYMDTYIPRYEDSPQVMWQKAQARDRALRRIYGAGRKAFDAEYGAPGQWQVLTDPRGRPKASGSQAQIPNGAIEALRRDRRLAGQFDAKYGKGQAAKVLSQ